MHKKPLIYSIYFINQTKDAAVLIDPDDAHDIAKAITKSMDKDFCEELIKLGLKRVQELNDEREASEADLLVRLKKFEKRLHCWKINKDFQ
jgi:hypothetical protein